MVYVKSRVIYTGHSCYYYSLLLLIIDVLIALQNACGDGWYFYVNEGTGSLTVCAEILFINGTALTTANYTVIVDSSSALSKLKQEYHRQDRSIEHLLNSRTMPLYNTSPAQWCTCSSVN
jgi:hypothetical protein